MHAELKFANQTNQQTKQKYLQVKQKSVEIDIIISQSQLYYDQKYVCQLIFSCDICIILQNAAREKEDEEYDDEDDQRLLEVKK